MSEEETISRLKDLNKPAFICQHLNQNVNFNLGFNVPYDIDKDCEAWCDECEKMFQEEGGWTDRAKKFANIQQICRYCFAEIRNKCIARQMEV